MDLPTRSSFFDKEDANRSTGVLSPSRELHQPHPTRIAWSSSEPEQLCASATAEQTPSTISASTECTSWATQNNTSRAGDRGSPESAEHNSSIVLARNWEHERELLANAMGIDLKQMNQKSGSQRRPRSATRRPQSSGMAWRASHATQEPEMSRYAPVQRSQPSSETVSKVPVNCSSAHTKSVGVQSIDAPSKVLSFSSMMDSNVQLLHTATSGCESWGAPINGANVHAIHTEADADSCAGQQGQTQALFSARRTRPASASCRASVQRSGAGAGPSPSGDFVKSAASSSVFTKPAELANSAHTAPCRHSVHNTFMQASATLARSKIIKRSAGSKGSAGSTVLVVKDALKENIDLGKKMKEEPGLYRSCIAQVGRPAQLRPKALEGLDDWYVFYMQDGKPYYHNTVTNVTQWEPPSARPQSAVTVAREGPQALAVRASSRPCSARAHKTRH